MTLVGLLYPGGDKSETVCTGYKVQPTKGLNLLKESECCALVQIVLCIPFLYINNIQKYYSVSRCVISIIIVFAPTVMKKDKPHIPTRVAMRYLQMVSLHRPLLVRTRLSNWYKKTVPVGRTLLSFSRLDNVVVGGLIWKCFGTALVRDIC